jgi:hypothetical protein
VGGVDDGIDLETKTRKEISGIEWVPVDSLPKPGGGQGVKVPKRLARMGKFSGEIRGWIRRTKGEGDGSAASSSQKKKSSGKKRTPKKPTAQPKAILTREIGAAPGKLPVVSSSDPAPPSKNPLEMLAGAVAQSHSANAGQPEPARETSVSAGDAVRTLHGPECSDWESFRLNRDSVMAAFWGPA